MSQYIVRLFNVTRSITLRHTYKMCKFKSQYMWVYTSVPHITWGTVCEFSLVRRCISVSFALRYIGLCTQIECTHLTIHDFTVLHLVARFPLWWVNCCTRGDWQKEVFYMPLKNFINRESAGIRSEICHPVEGYKVLLPSDWRNSKYEILADDKHSITIGDTTYYRIRALRRIERPFGLPPVEPGDLGGYVALTAGTSSLSNRGDCWIADEAFVSGYVSGDTQVTGHAHVGYPSEVTGKSLISDFAQVIDGAEVSESMVTDYAQVVGRNLEGLDKELISYYHRKQTAVANRSWISGRARVSDGAFIIRFSHVGGSAVVGGNVQLRKGAVVTGGVTLMSERGFVDLSGEVIDEPMNMWGFPTVLVTHADGEWISSAESFGADAYGAVLPYVKAEYTAGTSVAQKIADIYGAELEVGDGGDRAICVSSYDKDAGCPRPVHVSPVTGIAYLERPTTEEYEEFCDNLDEIVKQGRERRYNGHKWVQRTPEQEKAYRAQLKEAGNKADLAYWERHLRKADSEHVPMIEHIIKNIKQEMETEDSSDE